MSDWVEPDLSIQACRGYAVVGARGVAQGIDAGHESAGEVVDGLAGTFGAIRCAIAPYAGSSERDGMAHIYPATETFLLLNSSSIFCGSWGKRTISIRGLRTLMRKPFEIICRLYSTDSTSL